MLLQTTWLLADKRRMAVATRSMKVVKFRAAILDNYILWKKSFAKVYGDSCCVVVSASSSRLGWRPSSMVLAIETSYGNK